MKKLAIIFAAIAVLAGCQKIGGSKTYTFVDDTGLYLDLVNEMKDIDDEAEVEVDYFLMEYTADGLRVKSNNVDCPSRGRQYKFTAMDESEYLVVKLQMEVSSGQKDLLEVRYVSNVFLLKEGKDTEITITDNTFFQQTEPK